MFQAFMNYNFADYIQEGWLVIYMDNLAIGANLPGWQKTESPPHPTTLRWSWIIPKTIKMWIWKDGNWVPWYDCWMWLYPNGPCQAVCHCDLVSSEDSKGDLIFPWLLQLLPKIHPQLLQYRHSSHHLNLKRPALALDCPTTDHLQYPSSCIPNCLCAPPPWHLLPFHSYDGHIPPCQCYSTDGPLSFSSTRDPADSPLTSPQGRVA